MLLSSFPATSEELPANCVEAIATQGNGCEENRGKKSGQIVGKFRTKKALNHTLTHAAFLHEFSVSFAQASRKCPLFRGITSLGMCINCIVTSLE